MNRSPKRLKSAACEGKQAFEGYAKAARVASLMGKRPKKQNVLLSVYRCCFCALWHIGSKTRGHA